MGYLIVVEPAALQRGLSYHEAIEGLRSSFTAVAEKFVEAFPVRAEPGWGASLGEIRGALPRVQSPTRTADWSPLIYPSSQGDWELSEVHRQLCQVGVLIQSLVFMAQIHPHGAITGLSPTQQDGHDASGPDGAGGTWALEVFGGIDVRNNDKACTDADMLLAKQASHSYFACFAGAWRNYKPTRFSFEELRTGGAPEVRLAKVRAAKR